MRARAAEKKLRNMSTERGSLDVARSAPHPGRDPYFGRAPRCIGKLNAYMDIIADLKCS